MRPTIALTICAAGLVLMPRLATCQVTSNTVTVSWNATGDDGNAGIASQYDLRYSRSPITASNFGSASKWTGAPAPQPPGTTQSATVTGLLPGSTYYFAIKAGDEVPNWSAISNTISRTTLSLDAVRPAPVTNLAFADVTESTASIHWNAVGDDGRTGTAASYDVRFSRSRITEANWASAIKASGEPTPKEAGAIQYFTVTGLARETTYFFALKVTDDAGNVSVLSNVIGVTTPDRTSPSAIRDLTVVR